MSKALKTLELFGGIGAPRKALENIGVNIKSIDYVEILPYAVNAYNSLFNNDYAPQDVCTWNLNVDLLVHGSPCQDWSKNGNNDLSTGRSILYERTLEIIEHELHPRPKIVVWENVTGLLSERHIEHFNHYLSTMERLGYHNYFKILDSVDFGIPQTRERIFTVSIFGDDKEYKFPEAKPLNKKLLDYIDYTIKPEDYPLTENELSLFYKKGKQLFIRTNNSKGYAEVNNGDSINIERPNSTTRRGRVQSGRVPTLTTSPNIAIYYDDILRRISSRECWRLLGFTDNDFDRVIENDIPQNALFKLAGNSIVVPVLEALFGELFNQKFILL